jgi:hypothetical protein
MSHQLSLREAHGRPLLLVLDVRLLALLRQPLHLLRLGRMLSFYENFGENIGSFLLKLPLVFTKK